MKSDLFWAAVFVVLVVIWMLYRPRRHPANAETQVAPPISTERKSPNFDERNSDITHLVLHYTAMATAAEALDRLCDAHPPEGLSKVSSHYLVDEEGKIYRLVDESKRAWHAGVSYWRGDRNLNGSSIGIEIANPGDRPFPAAQMDAVRQLCQWIVQRHDIDNRNVIGHSDVAPGRKPDPGPFFDWRGLAAAGVGVWPKPEAQDYETSKNWNDRQVRQALSRVGYTSDADLKVVIDAFQRHFHPEVFSTPEKVGVMNSESAARLAWLVRKG